jgi:hypothetical protein
MQATSFGALLDVVLDIWLRGWLWVNALPASVALVPPLLEMVVLTVTHKVCPIASFTSHVCCERYHGINRINR